MWAAAEPRQEKQAAWAGRCGCAVCRMALAMSFLHEPGDLAQVPLAAVLLEVLNQRATGVLTVDHGQGASRVFLRDGVPVGGQSFAGFKPLGQALLAAGLIDVDALGKSLAGMAHSGRPFGGDPHPELGAGQRGAKCRGALSGSRPGICG